MGRGAFIFRVEQMQFIIFGFLVLKMKILRSFETSKFANANTKCHIKKTYAPQQCHCENLTSRIRFKLPNFPKSLCDIDAFRCDMGHLVSCFLLFIWVLNVFIHSFIHSVLDLTTGSQPRTKRVLPLQVSSSLSFP
jgi:hypothetical protein